MAKIEGCQQWDEIHPKPAANGQPQQPGFIVRLSVSGGWLVGHNWGDRHGPLVFLSDPDHTWDPKIGA